MLFKHILLVIVLDFTENFTRFEFSNLNFQLMDFNFIHLASRCLKKKKNRLKSV